MERLCLSIDSALESFLIPTTIFKQPHRAGRIEQLVPKTFHVPHTPIEQFTLENGLRVILNEDHSVPVVSVAVYYNVGSRNEREGRTGFAHLFEHMMFQGSENVPKAAHFQYISNAGGTMNGTTSSEQIGRA